MRGVLSSGRRSRGSAARWLAVGLLAIGFGALLITSSGGAAKAIGLPPPVNDLLALGQGLGQTPAKAPVVDRAEPPLSAQAPPRCGPGARPEPGIDGRVPAGSGNGGLWCNLTLVSHQGTSGGFKVFRYFDSHGHVCAFYDTALLFPTNAINLMGPPRSASRCSTCLTRRIRFRPTRSRRCR